MHSSIRHPKSLVGPVGADFTCTVSSREGCLTVAVAGELDMDSSDEICRVCIESGHLEVVVAMAELTFMDCSGYGGLLAARRDLERRFGTLEWRDAVGQPARLLQLVADRDLRLASV